MPPGEFQELICCPSRHGAHIIFAKDYALLYKVKVHLTHSEHSPRFDIYEVDHNDRAMHTSMGHMEKAHTDIVAKKGSFKLSQAWHVGCSKLELKDRKGVLHPKTFKKVATHTQAWNIDAVFELHGAKDFKTKTESWSSKFSLGDPQYVMKVDDGNGALASRAVRLFFRGQLICVARTQTFHHLRIRGSHERPFVGIRLLATDEHLGRGEDRSQNLSMASESWKLNSRSVATGVPGPQVLPLLLALAWGEDSINPPADQRDHFIRRMRSKDEHTVEQWQSPDGERLSMGNDLVETDGMVADILGS